MLNILAYIGVPVVVAALWYLRWSYHARRYGESGYTPSRPGIFGKFLFGRGSWLLTTLAVGRVKVKRKAKLPRMDHVIFAANHQFPSDFAMMRRGTGRHFRTLTDSSQLGGFFGVLSACTGVISIRFKDKAKDGPAAAEACKRVVAERRSLLNRIITCASGAGALLGLIAFLGDGHSAALVASGLCAWLWATMTWGIGRGGAVGIFPQGALVPENLMPAYDGQFHYGSFRPGAVKMAQEAALATGEHVYIVPVGIFYNRDKSKADFTYRHLAGARKSLGWKGKRNPKAWEPCFKVDVETLPADQKAEVLRQQEEVMEAYKKSTVVLAGGAVVVGEAIEISSLPKDPMQATEALRAKIAELTAEAEKLFG